MVKLAIVSAAAGSMLLLPFVTAQVGPPVQCTSALGGPIVVGDVDHKAGVKVQCALARQPTDTVSVALQSSKNLLTSQCNLFWTAANWSSVATLQLFPGTGMKTTTSRSVFSEIVTMTIVSTDITFNAVPCTFAVQRTVQAMATCSSFGDPHIITFDGADIINNLPGWHTYVQNERTTIQTLHSECGFNTLLCNKGIALQHGGEYMRLMTEPSSQSSNGVTTEVRFSVANPTQISVDTLNPDSKYYNIILSDGTSIRVTIQRGSSRFSQLSLTITAPGKYFATGMTGLCGNFDGQARNDECNSGEARKCNTYLCATGQCCNDVIVGGAVNPTTCRQTVSMEQHFCSFSRVTTNFAQVRPALNTVPPVATITTTTNTTSIVVVENTTTNNNIINNIINNNVTEIVVAQANANATAISVAQENTTANVIAQTNTTANMIEVRSVVPTVVQANTTTAANMTVVQANTTAAENITAEVRSMVPTAIVQANTTAAANMTLVQANTTTAANMTIGVRSAIPIAVMQGNTTMTTNMTDVPSVVPSVIVQGNTTMTTNMTDVPIVVPTVIVQRNTTTTMMTSRTVPTNVTPRMMTVAPSMVAQANRTTTMMTTTTPCPTCSVVPAATTTPCPTASVVPAATTTPCPTASVVPAATTTPCPTSSVVPAATPVTVTVEQCTSHCNKIFENVTCTSIDVKPYIHGCIADTGLVTSPDDLFQIASQTLESYLGACAQSVQGLANSPLDEDQEAAAVSAADNGVAYTPIGTNEPVIPMMECQNGGTNNEFGGCDCMINFSGLRCNVDNRQSLTSQNGAVTGMSLSVSAMMAAVVSVAVLMV